MSGQAEPAVAAMLEGIALVDGHHHLWQIGRFPYRWLAPDAPPARFGDKRSIARDYLLAEHAAACGGRLAGSVHVQANCGADDPVAETAWLQALADAAPWPIAIVGEADLAAPGAGALIARHRAHPALRGIRTPVAWDRAGRWRVARRPGMLADAAFRAAAAELAVHDLCLEMVVVPEQLSQLADFAAAQPDLSIVVDHFGTLEPDRPGNAARWRAGLTELAARPNVAMKLSGLWTVDKGWDVTRLQPHVDHLLDSFGAARVLWGSNAPVEAVNCPVPRQLAQLAILLRDRPRSDIAAIFGGTARRLYRLA
ncbi:hypothetical protein OG2516_16159 [Oceanicola granulosus HTCC2516]|uniref:Amidohydrolase-related domain-containing protein n=1 Tax=Oceanicola granulosus (strain ATCC BAA-861 / DSM 15982 / KCTC 12143 / HTCC2516) TaxID=314256 RepID=Q2CGT4_OCEGH|nr:amidohydrolase family protein [Oceanicola granulosus]EAR51851.1 hypothetical protein OG2516_16159 [Oceanicola granulosus HTCC2516]